MPLKVKRKNQKPQQMKVLFSLESCADPLPQREGHQAVAVLFVLTEVCTADRTAGASVPDSVPRTSLLEPSLRSV